MRTPDRYKGSLVGLTVGDALGRTLEFKAPGTFEPISDMMGGGPFHLKPGQWADDTSMALCLAESLIERRGFVPGDRTRRYLRWYRDGHLSSTGRCFDIGGTVRRVLEDFEKTGEPFCGRTDPRSAGNGSLMRLAPVPLLYAADPEGAIEACGESSRTTHGAQTAVDAWRWAFHRTDSFRDGCLDAVNVRDDADTTGAVYGNSRVRFTAIRRSLCHGAGG